MFHIPKLKKTKKKNKQKQTKTNKKQNKTRAVLGFRGSRV